MARKSCQMLMPPLTVPAFALQCPEDGQMLRAELLIRVVRPGLGVEDHAERTQRFGARQMLKLLYDFSRALGLCLPVSGIQHMLFFVL
jgi:hypothetical protein